MFIPVIQERVDSCFLPPVLQELLCGRLFFVCVQISELSSATNAESAACLGSCAMSGFRMPHLISLALGAAGKHWMSEFCLGWLVWLRRTCPVAGGSTVVYELQRVRKRNPVSYPPHLSWEESGSPKAGTSVQSSTSTVCPSPRGVCSD